MALCFGGHLHHELAAAWFDSLNPGEAGFCRIIQLALLRHLTNTVIMGQVVLSQRRAWACFHRLFANDRIIFLLEPDGLDVRWRQLTRSNQPMHRLWTDAYLAAFALAAGIHLSTIDQDFASFHGVAIELLRP